MQSTSQSAPAQSPDDAVTTPRKREDRMYQVVTVATIVLLLGSLWLF
jgi:hypothetical protein